MHYLFNWAACPYAAQKLKHKTRSKDMETAALLNKVNDFARENNCKCTVVVFEKGHEEDLPEKLFRMFTEKGAQIFKISTDTKGRTINAGGSSVGKARKTAAIKALHPSGAKRRKPFPQSANRGNGSRMPPTSSMSFRPDLPDSRRRNNAGISPYNRIGGGPVI